MNDLNVNYRLWWLLLLAAIEVVLHPPAEGADALADLVDRYRMLQELQRASEESGYQVDKLLAAVRRSSPA